MYDRKPPLTDVAKITDITYRIDCAHAFYLAYDLGLFELIKNSSMDEDEISKSLKLEKRPLQ